MSDTAETKPTYEERNGWLYDANNNRARIARYGDRAKAEAALASLKNCSDCSNCSYCLYCSDCSDCSNCSYCSYCLYCSDCSDCSYCSYCSDCSYCSRKVGEKKGAAAFNVPVVENLHQKVFAAASAPGALEMGDWHTCEHTHCRAGWIVTLAGKEGRDLEAKSSTAFAAMQIAKASGIPINPARFYDANDAALADMERVAKIEAGAVA